MFASKLKTALIIIGDIIILYGSLALTMLIRYGSDTFQYPLQDHLKPFSVIFIVWVLIFYLSDLYKNKFFRHNLEAIRVFIISIIVSIVISIILFYAFEPFFQLTPKTNLLIFGIVFGLIDYSWRIILIKIFISSGWKKQVLLTGSSPNTIHLIEYLKNNPQAGYGANSWIKEPTEENLSDLIEKINETNIEIVVIENKLKNNPSANKLIYKLLPLKMKILYFSDFYEMIFQKLPLEDLEESWFIEEITAYRKFYDIFKRIFDVLFSLISGIIFLPLIIVISGLIKASSKGPIIYKQVRTGKNEKAFILYKFRTMRTNQNGPLWTIKNDDRLTPLGKILRYSHLDELPQLYNILRGNISFIGPRPERSELVQIYKKLPFYEMRHIIKPGLTGWAQLNYKPSASVEEAHEKLRYDIFYIKNRSLFLDFLIILKTIKYIFISHS
ncbi:MAG: exopolysaccharide biosynthesis polyprenyl glycosylphosphotransferase [Patescibacteria group bacterium]